MPTYGAALLAGITALQRRTSRSEAVSALGIPVRTASRHPSPTHPADRRCTEIRFDSRQSSARSSRAASNRRGQQFARWRLVGFTRARQHHVQRRHRLPAHVAQRHGQALHAQFVFLAGQAVVVPAHLGDALAQHARLRHGMRRQSRQAAALEPGGQFGRAHGRQQHAAGRRGVRRQPRAQMQAVGQHARGRPVAAAARHDHHLFAVEHHGGKRFAGLRRQPVERRLQRARQARRRQVAAREAQHLGRHPEVAAVGFEVAQVRQRQQVAARSGARQAGALGRQRGVEALALGVEAFQHRHALGDAFDEVGLGDGHDRTQLRDDRAGTPMIAQRPGRPARAAAALAP